jgi:hypothetical protein
MNNKWPWLAKNIWIPIFGLGGGFIGSSVCFILIIPGIFELIRLYVYTAMLNKTPTIDIEALMYLTYIDNFLVCLGILVVASILFFLNDWLNPNSPEM